jgi:hypothetical protein
VQSQTDPIGVVTLTLLKPSLQDSLTAFETAEVRDDAKNLERCDKCKTNRIKTVTNTFQNWGPLVLLHLNRNRGGSGKDNTSVSFQLECHFMGRPYDLIAVVYHHGRSINKGHFSVKMRQPGKSWWAIDGANVTSCGARSVNQSNALSEAYMLLYQSRDWKNQVLPPPVKPLALGVVDLTGSAQQRHASTGASDDTSKSDPSRDDCTL